MGSQRFWYCELLGACGYTKGPRMCLFLFNIMWLLSPEDGFVLVNEHNFCYAPSGGILQGSSLDLCFVLLLSGLRASSISYYLSSEDLNVFKSLMTLSNNLSLKIQRHITLLVVLVSGSGVVLWQKSQHTSRMTKCKNRKIKRLQCCFLAVSNNCDLP